MTSTPFLASDGDWAGADRRLKVAEQEWGQASVPIAAVTPEQFVPFWEWIEASRSRADEYRKYLYLRVDRKETLSSAATTAVRKMLSDISLRFFPAHDKTIFDNHSLVAQASGLRRDSAELVDFSANLDEVRMKVAVLFDWYEWSNKQGELDPGGMFEAIEKKHKLTKAIAEGLNNVVSYLEQLCAMAGAVEDEAQPPS